MGLSASFTRSVLTVLVSGVSACSGDGSAKTTADASTTVGRDNAPEPPEDVCALLTLDDAKMLLPMAMTVEQEQPVNYPDNWISTCAYRGVATTYVELQIEGALSSAGLRAIDIEAGGHGDGPRTPVSGLGDRAAFYTSMGGLSVGLAVRRGNTLVDLGVNLAEQPPTEATLEPFVRLVFDRLHSMT